MRSVRIHNYSLAQLQFAQNSCASNVHKYKIRHSSTASEASKPALKKEMRKFPNVLDSSQVETIKSIRDVTDKYFELNYNALASEEIGTVDPETLKAIKELGLFGLQVDPMYGGIGLNNTQYSYLVESCGAADLAVSVIMGAHQSIGYKGIVLFGTKSQKEKYLPKLASGEQVACFCLTEPSAGSDAASVTTKAVFDPKKNVWVLNGSKIWISNGDIADVFTVFAQTTDANTGQKGMTAFIVERAFGGVKSAPPEKKMGIKCTHSVEVNFENVVVPAENVIGDVGKGFKVAMEILNSGRFGIGASMNGVMKKLLKISFDHVKNRTQFNRPLIEFQDIRVKLANICSLIYSVESSTYYLSNIMDMGNKNTSLESAITKIYASEAAWYTADEALQMLGGMGFMRESQVEKYVRDLRIFRIFEGTNDILRQFVALQYLKKRSEFLNNYSHIKLDYEIKDELPRIKNIFFLQLLPLTRIFYSKEKHISSQFSNRYLADLLINTYVSYCTNLRSFSSVKKFDRSSDIDVALYKTYLTNPMSGGQSNLGKVFSGFGKSDYLSNVEKIVKHLEENDGNLNIRHPIEY